MKNVKAELPIKKVLMYGTKTCSKLTEASPSPLSCQLTHPIRDRLTNRLVNGDTSVSICLVSRLAVQLINTKY